MDAASEIRAARRRASLTQRELAERSGTSQATVSAYEAGRKQPSVDTLERLLAAAGARLTVAEATQPVVRPSAAQLATNARRLAQVLELAAALPVRHERELRFPRLGAVQ